MTMPGMDRRVILQSSPQLVTEPNSDRDLFETTIRTARGVVVQYVVVEPHTGLALDALSRLASHLPAIAWVTHMHDNCLAAITDWPEIRGVMAWAGGLLVLDQRLGAMRYQQGVFAAIQLRRLLMLETNEEHVPAWRALWATVKGLPAP